MVFTCIFDTAEKEIDDFLNQPEICRMILVQSSDNPVPMNPVCGFIDINHKTKLRFARWRAKKRIARGTLVLLQGRAEYIEKMFETITDAREWGFDIVTFDWRNQGGSSRELKGTQFGHIENFGQYVTDFDTIMKQVVLPDCPAPIHVVAHSMGAPVALLAASRSDHHIQRLVLCSPFLKLGRSSPSQNLIRYPVCFLNTIGLGKMPLGMKAKYSQKLIDNELTSDTKRFRRNQRFMQDNPHLSTRRPTVAWLHAAIRATEAIAKPKCYNRVIVPVLMINAGNDTVVDPQAAETSGRMLPSGSTLIINGARHELMQERDIFRNQTLSAIKAFICKK